MAFRIYNFKTHKKVYDFNVHQTQITLVVTSMFHYFQGDH